MSNTMNPAAESLRVTTPSDREIVMTRVFDAPRRLVWDAHTKPELVKRWLGVRAGWTLSVCEIDLKVGGRYRYVWRSDQGVEMGMGGTYREVVPIERIVSDEAFDQKWYEGTCIDTIVLVEQGGRTTLTISLLYDSKAVRDSVLKSPMKEGMSQGYDGLAALLASLEVK